MQIPLQIIVRDFPQSQALETSIRQKVGNLTKIFPNISSCRVVVEESRQHQFLVSLDVRVPGGEIVVNHVRNEDAYVATRDAFDAARRQLDKTDGTQRADAGRSDRVARQAAFAETGL